MWSDEETMLLNMLLTTVNLFQGKKALICFSSLNLFVTLLEEFLSFVKTYTHFFVISFLGMTAEYELEKQLLRDVLQTGIHL